MLSGRVISSDRRFLRIEAGKIFINASGNIEDGNQVHTFLRPENIALSKTSTQSRV